MVTWLLTTFVDGSCHYGTLSAGWSLNREETYGIVNRTCSGVALPVPLDKILSMQHPVMKQRALHVARAGSIGCALVSRIRIQCDRRPTLEAVVNAS